MCKILPICFLFLALLFWSCTGNEAPGNPPPNNGEGSRDTATPPVINTDTARDFRDLVAQYEQPDRVNWQKPREVIEMMGDLRGKTVAEIGAGTGYFTFRLVPHAEKVIAVDIDPRMIEFMNENRQLLPDEYRERLETRLVQPDDPMLGEGEVDLILLANTYIYIDDRVRYFRNLRNSLRDDGAIFIVDFKKRNVPVGPSYEAKVPLHEVEREMLRAGYDILLADECTLPFQYILFAGLPE